MTHILYLTDDEIQETIDALRKIHAEISCTKEYVFICTQLKDHLRHNTHLAERLRLGIAQCLNGVGTFETYYEKTMPTNRGSRDLHDIAIDARLAFINQWVKNLQDAGGDRMK